MTHTPDLHSMADIRAHWDKVYMTRPSEQLGWYEDHPLPSIRLLEQCLLHPEDPILVAGAGTSTFINFLAEKGFSNVIATDISSVAILKLKERLGKELAAKITWIADDLTRPEKLNMLEGIALWFDRAVLHFFTDPEDREEYFRLLRRVLRPGGYAIIAAFSLKGAKKCSGLDVKNYDATMLAESLGDKYILLESFDHVHTMPSGESRDYIYTLFQRSMH